MTKKLLLSAAAVAAMAFAGAAGAADITKGKISGVGLTVTADGLTPYAIANETKLVADNLKTITSDATPTNLEISMDSPVAIAANAVIPFAVEFKLEGDAVFTAASAYNTLKAYDYAANGSVAATIIPESGMVILSNQGKVMTYYVEYKGPAGGATIEALDITALGITIKSRSDVKISATANVTLAGFTQEVTKVTPTQIIGFKNALKPIKLDLVTESAALTDYTEFGTANGAQSATVSSNVLNITTNANVYANALGGTPLAPENILNGVKAVVTGPQVEAFGVTVSGETADEDTLTATSGEYALAVPGDFGGNNVIVLNNADEEVIEAGTYSIALTPEFKSAYEGNAAVTLDAIKVTLEGTNFYVPWFALNNSGANSTLRLANNGSTAVGPVIISLKANNGTSAPKGTHTIASIPAGGFVSVTGTTLKSAFLTDAANGDLQVTIQANVANVSAKVRTTQAGTQQIFENSIGATIDQID